MAELVNVQTNKIVTVPDSEVSRYLESGQFNLPASLVSDHGLEMLSPDGEIVDVGMEGVYDALDDGYTLESQLSRDARALRKEYTGFLPGLKSAALGAAKGLTFGLSTPVAQALGADVEAYEAFQPGAMLTGEVVGTGASLLGTLGTGGIVGGGVRGAAALAEAGGAKAAAKLAEKTFGQKLLKSTVKAGVEGTLDGAMYGAGEAVHELSLQRAELTGQSIASHFGARMTEGALIGGAFGGTLNALGVPVVAAMRKASGPAKKALAAANPVTLPKVFNTAEEFFKGVADEAGFESLGAMLKSQRILSKRDAADPGWLGRAKRWLTDTKTDVDGQQVPLIGATDTWEDMAPKLGAARDRIGNQLKGFYSEVDKYTKPTMGASSSNIVDKLNEIKAQFPDATTAAERNALDDAIIEAKKIGLKEDLRRHQELGGKPLQARMKSYTDWRGPEYRDFINAKHTMGKEGRGVRVVDDFLLDVEELTASQIDEIWGLTHKGGGEFLKMRLPNTIETKNQYWGRSGFDATRPSDVSKLNRKIGNIWRNESDDAAEEVVKIIEDLGGEAKTSMQEFRKLKDEFGYASEFWKIVEDRALRAQANRKFSLSDHLMTVAGSGIGAFGGGPFGGMVGASIGAVGNRYLRERGLSLTTAGARSLAKLAKRREATIAEIRKRASEAAKGTAARAAAIALPLPIKTLTAITFTGEPPKGDTKEEVMGSLIGQIDSFAQDPEKLASHLNMELGELETIAPEVAVQVATTKSRMVQFLQEKSPKIGDPYSTLQPMLYRDSYLDQESLAKFERYLVASIDPINAFYGDFANGSVMKETVEAIRHIYPALLEQIQAVQQEEVSEREKPLSTSEADSLAKLYDAPMVAYQNAAFMRRQQAQYKVESKGSMAGVKPSSASQGRTELLMQTDVNAVQSNLRSNKFA